MSPSRSDAPTFVACLAVAALGSGIALSACAKHDTTAANTHSTAPAVAASAPKPVDASAIDGGDGAATILSWTEAIRAEKWQDAENALARLSLAELAKPEVRFARARVAIALGKDAPAIALLDRLEDDLPLLRELIAKTRASALLRVGPFDKAAEWYAARSQPFAWLTAAEAWEKAGDVGKARAQCDRVIGLEKKSRALEEKARAFRMRLLKSKESDPAFAADARWLAIHGFDDKTVDAATAALDKLSPAKPLVADELIARAHARAEDGASEEALRVIERAIHAKGNLSSTDLCRARAEAYYKDRARARYADAALAYRACAALGGTHAAEDSFLSARAFSRADRDGEALAAFAGVAQRFPRTTWADESEFHIARTHALAGKWRDAAHAFDEHLKHFPTSKQRHESERYRAIAHLMAHDDKIARKLLEELAGSADDPVTRARWQNLAALAADRDGDHVHAVARWQDIVRSRPLSWPAMVARARLIAASANEPPAIEPAESGASEPLVIELPPPVDILHRIGFDADAEEALRERESVVSAKAVGRGTEALCAAYAMLDRARRRYQLSRDIPAALLSTAPGGKNRWAWECTFPRPHKDAVRAVESRAKLPTDLIWSVMRQESAFDPEALSPARAVGLLQLLPETAKSVAVSAKIPHDEAWLVRPTHNIELGALYLKELLDKLNANTPLAVGAYNGSPEAILRWESHAAGEPIDVFVEAIPFVETRGYVVRVMGNLARYGFLESGDAGVPRIALDLK